MNEEKKVQIQLEKHLWPDEVIEKRRKKRTRLLIVTLSLCVFTFGFLVGNDFSENTTIVNGNNSIETSKFDTIQGIMSSQWFFKDELENGEEQLMDQALYGMANNEIDPHTTYMSRQDVEDFTTGIDMGFVGIGVQYNATDGLNVITRVFQNSPAQKAGVLPGDRIYSVDGELVEGMESDEIASKVKGLEGTVVQMGFLRNNEIITIDITRAPVNNTAYGEMLQDDIGYLQIYQFGSSTGNEAEEYLQLMTEQGMKKLIIDVRDDGGGYLAALVDIASLFLPEDTVAMQQVYSNGAIEFTKTKSGMFENIEEIVILVNEATASASEVLTLALKEERDDVTIVGTTTFGKGTVQVTHSFVDGSALKYTTSKWLSPSGVWVDETGITPDVEVFLHDVLYMGYDKIEDEVLEIDSVSSYVEVVQNSLDFLGYDVKRLDGYFDQSTYDELVLFQKELNIEAVGVIDNETLSALTAEVTKVWSMDKSYDSQLQKAIEVINE